MHRRELLAGLAVGLGTGLAGCGQNGPRSAGETPAPGGQGGSTPVSVGDVELPVPLDDMRVPLPRDHIPAIVDPAFAADWSDVSVPENSRYDGGPLLPNDAPIVGVERDGAARAYPLRILNWHEAVNDTFGGPLLVTFCPLCGSAVTAERRADGGETIFGVSGRLWRNDMVLYDRATESLWSQLLATAIHGPLTGEQFSLLPSSLTTWGEWRAAHPDTEVLLPPPESNTVRGRDATFEYFTDKYNYSEDQLIGYVGNEGGQPAPRRLVIGVTADGEARAYPFDVVRDAGVVNDQVGDLPVVVTVTPGGTLVAYDRRVGGRVLQFGVDDDTHLRADGSRWERATGRAVDGPHSGTTLDSATDVPAMFWKGWRNFHPETTIYEGS